MRYIDITSLPVPADWINLSDTNPKWSYLKDIFEDIVGKKCWYNESSNIATSNPIDHFRPKATTVKILEPKYASLDAEIWAQILLSSQTGYPFLELEFTNYRYASGYANSPHKKESRDGITRGKSNFFPIKINTSPATRLADLHLEKKALLDPCDVNDPEMLNFNEFGGIDPNESILPDSWNFCRVKISVEIYNLMYRAIKEKRQETWNSCEKRLEILCKLFKKSDKSQEEKECFDHILAELFKSLLKKAEYSAVVIDCIKYYRKRKDPEQYRFVHDVIPDALLIK